jgi:hypothetical protein
MSQIQRNKTYWWSIVETLSLSVSIAGSITALFLQQTTLAIAASFPLSAAMGLNLLNRKQLERDIYQHKATISQLERQHSEKFKYLDQALQLLPNPVDSNELKTIVHQIVEESQSEIISQLKSIEEFDLRSLKSSINQLQNMYPSLRERLEILSESIDSDKELLSSKISTRTSEFQNLESRLDSLFLLQENIFNRLQFLESFDLELLEKGNNEFQDIHPILRKGLDDLYRNLEPNKNSFLEELTFKNKEIQEIKNSLSLISPALSDFELRIQKLESLLASTPLPSQIIEDSHSERVLNYFKDQIIKLETKIITEPSPRIGGVEQASQTLVCISRDKLVYLIQNLSQHFNRRENINVTTTIQRRLEAEIEELNGRRFSSGIHVLKDQVIAIVENLKHEI